jgi:hypothetical protein
MRCRIFAAGCLAMMIVSGCGKKAESPPQAQTPETKASSVSSVIERGAAAKAETPAPGASVPEAASVTTPAETATAPTDKLPTASSAAARTAIQTPTAIKITEAMQRFLERNNRLPKDFNELVSSKFLPSMPPAPAGKKYVLERTTLQVVLVDQ